MRLGRRRKPPFLKSINLNEHAPTLQSMAAKKKQMIKVHVDSLKDGMIIKAYTSFSANYRPIDKSTRDFVRHNFKNTRAIISRQGNKQDIPIQTLESGDELLRIHSFPSALQKLTLVKRPLVQELKKRGMIGFYTQANDTLATSSKIGLQELLQQVEQVSSSKQGEQVSSSTSRKGLSIIKEKRQQKAKIANTLVRKVRESVEIRRDATATVEHTMDLIRKGTSNINDLKHFAKTITKSASAEALTALAGLHQSDQIYSHCIDVGAIFQTTYFKIIEKKGARSIFQTPDDVIMSALLHDLGKSKIPKAIIDSTERYEKNSRATQILRSHPVFGAQILAGMNLPNYMIEMTHYHHVKQETSMLSSYPTGVNFKDISFETRLLSIVDIYQALVGKRQYQKSWSPPATMRYLDALAGIEYDLRAWEPFLQMMGVYPKGSLVELSDNSLGFVMSVPRPGQNLEKPLVAIIRNGRGENLTHHDIIDLRVEKGLKIINDLDSQDIFGDKALAVFTSISIS
ncbi:MAG: HD domain-containing protein [SAR324 cluster bacterium]|nr:HD domain-containing protein [SAR324 cluster bacterium]